MKNNWIKVGNKLINLDKVLYIVNDFKLVFGKYGLSNSQTEESAEHHIIITKEDYKIILERLGLNE